MTTLSAAPSAAVPTVATAPTPGARSEIEGIRSVAAEVGSSLWEWQRVVSTVALERRADNRWRYPIVTVCVPRQSGKTTLVGLVAFHRCLSAPDQRVWYTAQSRQDAVGRFKEFARMLRRSDMIELSSGVRNTDEYRWDYRIRLGVGAELIEFHNGSSIQVFAPAEDSLHGSVTDLIIFDEARFFDEGKGRDLMAAALPTMATRDGQLWIVSTGGGPESTFLAAELEKSRAEISAPDSRRCHVEYGIGFDVADHELLERVWECHPSAGCPGGPQLDALSVAASAMSPAQFAHEYGNRWRSEDERRLIPAGVWADTLWQELPAEGAVHLGVDVAADRSSAAVVACVGGVLHVLDYRPGATWVADRVVELATEHDAPAVWVEPGGPSAGVSLELGARLTVCHPVSVREATAACAGLQDALLSVPPSLGHTPSDALDFAVANAAHRRVGQAWVWSRVESGPVLMAASLAFASYRAAATAPDMSPMIW